MNGGDYLTDAQVEQILKAINPVRVSERDGNSYVQAFEVKAHMARIFGICRWSSEVVEQHKIVEREVKTKAGKDAWQVGYHSVVKVTVYSPNGTHLATYTEGHAGGSTHPDLVEAHGNAITNSESYAFKRSACMALLDQGGLSLYGGGSKKALVGRTVMMPPSDQIPSAPVDAHLTEPVAEERDTDARTDEDDPKPEPRVTSTPKDQGLAALVAQAEQGPAQDVDIKQFYAKLRARAAAVGVKGMIVGNTGMSLGSYIDVKQRERLAAR